MNIQKIMQNEKERLERSIQEKQELISKLPDGVLQIYNTKYSHAWFVNNNRKRNYIPKSDRSLAEDLAFKAFLQAELRDNKEDLKATDMYLRNCSHGTRASDYLSRNDEYNQLVQPRLNDFDCEIQDWLNDTYTGKVPRPENLKYMTKAGFRVRSKSEQIIVSNLVDAKLPFKYEQAMMVNLKQMHPDFMIMHPKTHKIYIWEHMGMMDDINYLSNSLEKIKDYNIAGFHPGENLILTYETSSSGIDEILINKLICHYFS